MAERLYTVKEAAGVLRCSEGTVRALWEQRALRHERVGTGRGRLLIPESAIKDYRKSRTVAARRGDSAATPAPAPRPAVKLVNLRLRSGD